MLFIYRIALDNESDHLNNEKATIYFHDTKTDERFSATCMTIKKGDELRNETTPKGNPLFESSSEWLIETDKGDKYTRMVEHRIPTHIFYPDGWDSDQTDSTPISLHAMNCSSGGSIRIGIDADKWVKIERGDL